VHIGTQRRRRAYLRKGGRADEGKGFKKKRMQEIQERSHRAKGDAASQRNIADGSAKMIIELSGEGKKKTSEKNDYSAKRGDHEPPREEKNLESSGV